MSMWFSPPQDGHRDRRPFVHTGAEVFETDRRRQNLLILDGWCVLRFTWTMIEEHPEEVIAMVREAIEILTAAQS
jgi:very-short-patch-repair endonuclease